MNFEETFPLRFWINLGRREDRRVALEAKFEEQRISAERFVAIDARWSYKTPECGIQSPAMRAFAGYPGDQPGQIDPATTLDAASVNDVRGYESAGRYALALTQRMAIREAARRKAPAVLLLEDDVVFHPNFRILIEAVELPGDWGIFYLGCAHGEAPMWAGRRVVKANWAVDTHAIAFSSRYYDRILEVLDRHGKPDSGIAKASDQFIALLHREIPAYACYPNLAWQETSGSDLIGVEYSNYHEDGLQRNWPDSIAHLLPGLVGERIEVVTQQVTPQKLTSPGNEGASSKYPQFRERHVWLRRPPKLGLLFLTRGDVNHPQIWREFVAESPDRVRTLSHVKNPREAQFGFLKKTQIERHFHTEWGGIGLVKASRALLLEALEDESLTHFVLLSESCVPIRPLPEILRRLELDPRPQFSCRTIQKASARHASRASAIPEVPNGCWRFQSQWWLLDRVAATFAAGQDFTDLFAKMEIPDEAYFATVLSMQGYPLEGTVLKKDVTWTWWTKGKGSPEEWETLPPERMQDLMHSGALFARKFPRNADIWKYGLHRSVGQVAAEKLELNLG